jgi:hypothetical protein
MVVNMPTAALPKPPMQPDWEKIWGNALEKPEILTMLLKSRKLVGHGTYGAVFNVSGVAVKIGYVPPEEAERQDWVQRNLGFALPVIAYAPQLHLPEAVTKQACPIHGMDYDEESWNCHCGEPMDILVMPLAKYAGMKFFDARVRTLVSRTQNALCERFHFFWEEKPSHLLEYDGRLVLADFGEEDVDWW